MKDYKTMTFDELAVARREMNDKLGELYTKAANREFKPEEAQEEINLTRELKQIDEQMKVLNRENEHEKALGDRRQETLQAQFRELLKDSRNAKDYATECTAKPFIFGYPDLNAVIVKRHEPSSVFTDAIKQKDAGYESQDSYTKSHAVKGERAYMFCSFRLSDERQSPYKRRQEEHNASDHRAFCVAFIHKAPPIITSKRSNR